MSDITLRAVARQAVSSAKDAATLLMAIQAAVVAHLGSLDLWCAADMPFQLDARLTSSLDRSCLPHVGGPRFATHQLTLLDARRGGKRIGGLTLATHPECTGPGLVFSLRLAQDRVRGRDLRALVRSIAALGVNEAAMGPDSIVHQERVGALNFIASAPKLPGGSASAESVAEGFLVRAHDGWVGATDASSIAAIRRLATILPVWRPAAPLVSRRRAGGVVVEAAETAPVVAVPSYLTPQTTIATDLTEQTGMMPPTDELRRLIHEAEPRVAISRAAERLPVVGGPAPGRAGSTLEDARTDATSAVDGRQILAGLKLPFDQSAAAPAATGTKSSNTADGEYGETLMAPMSPELRAALPFAATVPPDLARYVELTLALASQEERLVVLARFGLDETARERLSAKWAARFAKDAGLRETFTRLVLERRR